MVRSQHPQSSHSSRPNIGLGCSDWYFYLRFTAGGKSQSLGTIVSHVIYQFMDKNPSIFYQKRCYNFIKELAHKLQCLPASILCSDISAMTRHPLAEGNYGVVYRGRYQERDVAVKALRPKRDSAKSILEASWVLCF